ncbi:MAG: MBL fold metallo-hydrolase [Lentisphaeria bacterium]|nr:MBL fold metallo-hydrolase [Lentisphaeria bacterium]
MAENPFTTLVVGDIGVNCYLVPGPHSGNLYIIDPGDDAADIIDAAKNYPYKEALILLTHAHVDHIGACGAVAKKLGITKVCLNAADSPLYSSPENHLMPYLPPAKNLPPVTDYFEQDDFSVIETPGHTRGSVCLWFKDYNTLFTGDTLFQGSVGRTDLPGGDYDALMRSIKEKLMPLPEDLRVFPGHQYWSTIGREKSSNPYIC